MTTSHHLAVLDAALSNLFSKPMTWDALDDPTVADGPFEMDLSNRAKVQGATLFQLETKFTKCLPQNIQSDVLHEGIDQSGQNPSDS